MSYVAPTHSWPSSEAVPSAPVVSSFASVVPSANVLAPVGVTVNRAPGSRVPSSATFSTTIRVGTSAATTVTPSASTRYPTMSPTGASVPSARTSNANVPAMRVYPAGTPVSVTW